MNEDKKIESLTVDELKTEQLRLRSEAFVNGDPKQGCADSKKLLQLLSVNQKLSKLQDDAAREEYNRTMDGEVERHKKEVERIKYNRVKFASLYDQW